MWGRGGAQGVALQHPQGAADPPPSIAPTVFLDPMAGPVRPVQCLGGSSQLTRPARASLQGWLGGQRRCAPVEPTLWLSTRFPLKLQRSSVDPQKLDQKGR